MAVSLIVYLNPRESTVVNPVLLELRFIGKNLKPKTLSIKELTTLLDRFDRAMKAIMVSRHPHLEIPPNYISLENIKHNSIGLQCAVNSLDEESYEAFSEFSEGIQSGDYDNFPAESLDSLNYFSTFNKKRNSTMVVGTRKSGRFKKLAEFKGIEKSKLSSFSDTRTLYGELIQIGGKTNPKAILREYSGREIQGDISKEMAMKNSHLLYKEIKATGVVKISGHTLAPLSFRIDSISPFKALTMEESIDSIRAALKSSK